MKKNILAAIVIVFVTCACILAINEATGKKAPEVQVSSFYVE